MSLYLKTSKTSAVGTHGVKNGGEEWPLEFIGCKGVSLEVFKKCSYGVSLPLERRVFWLLVESRSRENILGKAG